MEGVPELQIHSFGCLSNVTKRYWRLNYSVAFQKKAWEDTSTLKPNPGSVPDCCVPLNADPEELLRALQHLQKWDPDGAVRGHCQQHVQWYVGTLLSHLTDSLLELFPCPVQGVLVLQGLFLPQKALFGGAALVNVGLCFLLFCNLALVWNLREVFHFLRPPSRGVYSRSEEFRPS